MFSTRFICGSRTYSSYTNFAPAPMFRKSFVAKGLSACTLDICGLGFYELYLNGKRITKGFLAPYISNPDDLVYYDRYDLLPLLQEGENVLGVILGNGMQNAPGGQIWDFDIASFRGVPRLAFALETKDKEGNTAVFEATDGVKTAPSPILFDDLRCGCIYDAGRELAGWCSPGFDDSAWAEPFAAECPRGEAKFCGAEPILPYRTLKPVNIRPAVAAEFNPRGDVPKTTNPLMNKSREGFLYDFGENVAGVPTLRIKGKKGQQVDLQFAEELTDKGEVFYSNINFYPDGFAQRDIYILKGEGEEEFTPLFTYHGARYCLVLGITEEQATEDLLTFAVCSSAMEVRGDFTCSDPVAVRLQQISHNSDLSNFYYFPTDCPHREKNGWTGDAACSCDHTTFFYATEKSYGEWLCNLRKAQGEDGNLPGIVPTGGWGFAWGNGPAWDLALTELTYRTYLYRGDKTVLEENADAIFKYLNRITNLQTERKTVVYGLGDWCPVTVVKAPPELTNTLICMDICQKAAYIFGELGKQLQMQFAKNLFAALKTAARKYLINFNTMTAVGACQTSQAMAIYYGAFEDGEKPEAFRRLLDFIHAADDHIDFGLLGSRTVFRVLGDFGYADLAYKMICRTDHPSYGDFIRRGMTALPEDFHKEGEPINSLNHHFMGDYTAFFAHYVAGININPHGESCKTAAITPNFIESLTFAEGYYNTVCGKLQVRWEREEENILLTVKAPRQLEGTVTLPAGWIFAESKLNNCALESDTYTVVKA